MQYLIRLLSVEVIGVDDSERLFDEVFTHEYGVVGTPRFAALRVVAASCRYFIDRLETDLALYFTFVLTQYDAAEIILEVLADDKHDLAKTCAKRIIDTVVQDSLAVRAQAVHLFQSSVAAAHSGRQNK